MGLDRPHGFQYYIIYRYMRKFLAIALVVMAAIGCGKESISSRPQKIGFDSQISRALIDSPEALCSQQIRLFGSYTFDGSGAPVFDGERLYYDSQIEAWDYNNTQYWIMGAYYHFSAVCPYSVACTYTDGGEVVIPSYSSYTEGSDILYAHQVRDLSVAEDYSAVPLHFHHACSAVKFSIVNGSSSVLTDVRNIRLVGLHNRGEFRIGADGTAAWTLDSSTVPAVSEEHPFAGVCTLPSGGLPVNISVDYSLYDTGAVVVLPQSIYKSGVTLHLEYKKVGDSAYAVRDIELGMLGGTTPTEWKAGEVYKYKLNITDNTITAEVTVVDWIDNFVDL